MLESPEFLPGPLEQALRKSVEGASWLQGTDGAAVELAAMYAQRIDQGTREFRLGEIDSSSYNKVLYLGPHLLNTLKAVGLSPEDRMKIMLATGPVKEADVVDELKNRRRKRASGQG